MLANIGELVKCVKGSWCTVNPISGFSKRCEALSAQALQQVIECANQLRNRCGECQVPNAKVAMAQAYWAYVQQRYDDDDPIRTKTLDGGPQDITINVDKLFLNSAIDTPIVLFKLFFI